MRAGALMWEGAFTPADRELCSFLREERRREVHLGFGGFPFERNLLSFLHDNGEAIGQGKIPSLRPDDRIGLGVETWVLSGDENRASVIWSSMGAAWLPAEEGLIILPTC